jgi:hypothetical protein
MDTRQLCSQDPPSPDDDPGMVFDFMHGLAQVCRVQATGNHNTNDIGTVVIGMDCISCLAVLIELDDLVLKCFAAFRLRDELQIHG